MPPDEEAEWVHNVLSQHITANQNIPWIMDNGRKDYGMKKLMIGY